MWLIITALIGITLINAEAKRDFVIEINTLHYNTTQPNALKVLNYSVLKQKYVTLEVSLKRQISNIEVRYRFDMFKKDNTRINLLSLNIDGCKGLESVYTIPLIATMTKEIFRKGNLPRRCPVKADELYYVRNFTFNAEDYPMLTPIMSFQSFAEFYFDKQYQGSCTCKGRIRKIHTKN